MRLPNGNQAAGWSGLAVALLAMILAGGSCRRATSPKGPIARPAPAPARVVLVRVDANAVTTAIGIKPGGLKYDRQAGSAAVLRARAGSVAVRRTGEEKFADVGTETKLYPGDQLRTGASARAMLVVVDQTVIELAEDSALVIGNRAAEADPASSAGVLYGIARFSVSPRAPGEGPFLVNAGTGVVATKATTYAIGVAASGIARVGVESGEVEVTGGSELKRPVTVGAAQFAILDAQGTVGTPMAFSRDDWAGWRDEMEAQATAEASAQLHAQRLPELQARIDRGYEDLQKLATQSIDLLAKVANDTGTGDRKALRRYRSAAPECAAAIEATFRVSLDLQRLTHALMSDAYILGETFVRHPDVVEATYITAAANSAGAVLYNKKYQVIADTTLGPLRSAYYMHHPRGRQQANAVGFTVPAFFAEEGLEPLAPDAVARRLRADVYLAPRTPVSGADAGAKPKTVWLGAPRADWDAWLVVPPAAARGEAWYAPLSKMTGKLVAGVQPTLMPPVVFEAMPATEIAKVEVSFLASSPATPELATTTPLTEGRGETHDLKVRASHRISDSSGNEALKAGR